MEEEKFESIVQAWKERAEQSYESERPSMSEEHSSKDAEKKDYRRKIKAAAPLAPAMAADTVLGSQSAEEEPDKTDQNSDTENHFHRRDSEGNVNQNTSESSNNFDNDDHSNKNPKKPDNKADKMDGVYVKKNSSMKSLQSGHSEEKSHGCDQCIVDCLYYSMECCSIS